MKQNLFERLKQYPGSFMRITVRSEVSTLKNVESAVEKESVLFVCAGCEYANRKEVKEALAQRENGSVGPLPWGEWLEYPYAIQHKGQTYFRAYPPTDAQAEAFNLFPIVRFFECGKEIDRNRAIELCGSKAKASAEKALVYTIKESNIIDISPCR